MTLSLPTELLPLTARCGDEGQLLIAGLDVVALAEQYGTPLYLYDQATMDAVLATYRSSLARHWPGEAEVAYAAKAWLSSAMARWAATRGLGMDVVSEGELLHALHAGFPPRRVHAHGNNKPDSFLHACIVHGVGAVVIDHPREAARLAALCAARDTRQVVWLRPNPATAADTHVHIETGNPSAKFGLGLDDGVALATADMVLASSHLELRGVHFHIGSQFADTVALRAAIQRVFEWLRQLRDRYEWVPMEFSPGGGWAVPYTPGAPYLEPEVAIRELSGTLGDAWNSLCPPGDEQPPLPRLVLEPGRELVARAGVALYRVDARKRAGERTYLFINGGMADNPRPALYGARYHALIANRLTGKATERVAIAGPFCESADVLIPEVVVHEAQEGDILAVPVSGAYQLSMASNYNGTPRPAALWLNEGKARVARRREQVAELWTRDCLLQIE